VHGLPLMQRKCPQSKRSTKIESLCTSNILQRKYS
jgi:hypothetical protein